MTEMRRSRKWRYMAQEAGRLAEMGLSGAAIAQRLGVHKATVCRWMATGKLRNTRQTVSTASAVLPPLDWAATVRKMYALDASDEELVNLATAALEVAKDPAQPPMIRLAAAGRFQALVKQLALVARPDDATQTPDVVTRPHRADPRAQLAIVR
jgi:transposase-like protein